MGCGASTVSNPGTDRKAPEEKYEANVDGANYENKKDELPEKYADAKKLIDENGNQYDAAHQPDVRVTFYARSYLQN